VISNRSVTARSTVAAGTRGGVGAQAIRNAPGHVELTAQERAGLGIPAGLIRYSAGIEDGADLVAARSISRSRRSERARPVCCRRHDGMRQWAAATALRVLSLDGENMSDLTLMNRASSDREISRSRLLAALITSIAPTSSHSSRRRPCRSARSSS
jgi:hypothetical protein